MNNVNRSKQALAFQSMGRELILATVKEEMSEEQITATRQPVLQNLATGKVGFVYLPESAYQSKTELNPEVVGQLADLTRDEVYVIALVVNHPNLWRGTILGELTNMHMYI